MTRQTSTTSHSAQKQSRPQSLSSQPERHSQKPPHNPPVDCDSPTSEQQPDSPEFHPDPDFQRQPPNLTYSKRRRPATASNPSQASRKRKAAESQNEISSQVHQYLSETDSSLWSLEHLKTVIGKKYPAKQKWYLQTQLEEICRTSSPGSLEAGAARRVLRVLNPKKDFSAPMATFSITANAPLASTVIYAQKSTINTSPVLGSSLTGVPGLSFTAVADSSRNCKASGDTPVASDTTLTCGGPVTPTRGNASSHPLSGSPSLSQSSIVDYGPYEIVDFLYIYPNLCTKFPLRTDTRDTTLEDLLRNYLLDPGNASLVKENILLQAGFIDIASQPPQLLSSKEYAIVKAALRSNSDSHIVAHCVEECFSNCSTYETFIDARNMFSCRKCKYNPLFQQATSAVIHTVHFLLNTAILSPLPLEGNFDVLWSSIIDHAFISPYGVLHRKEKTSPLSPDKFDGLYIGGRVEPQEWLVIEVARSSGQGLKQILDRQKLIEHCLRILTYRRWYLGSRTDLRGRELTRWLSRFPMWGVLCQGLGIEIVRFSWLSKGVGVVTTFASRFPEHMMRLESLWRILEEVHVAALEVKECVQEWDKLHGGMVGNRIT